MRVKKRVKAIVRAANFIRAMRCVAWALCFLAPAALAAVPSLCEIQGNVSLAWEGFEDGVSHSDLGTAGQNNDYWRLEIDRVANTSLLQRSSCIVSLLLSDVPDFESLSGGWLASLQPMYPGADGGTQVHEGSGNVATNFDCEAMSPSDYCTNIVIAGPAFGHNSGCDERHTYARYISSGCRGLDMPAFGAGEYYAFVSTFDSIASVSSDVRRIPGTFVIGEPIPSSGVGDGGNSDDDHGDAPDTATVVAVNSTTQGDLENGGDEDVFRIEISQAGRLAVGTTGNTDTFGTLSGPTRQIAEDDDGGDGTNFLIVTDVQAGRHHVHVRGYTATVIGPYALVVEYSSQDGAPTGTRATYRLPLVTAARNTSRQGFVRVINRSDRAGSVRIHAIDDSGTRYGPVTLSVSPKATMHFNAGDLEDGNVDKGLSGGVGSGSGDWWLELTTDLDILPLAYIRTSDGFLAAVHDVVPKSEGTHHVPIFNPASNDRQVSLLRLVNLNDRVVDVTIEGIDDGGEGAAMGQVNLQLPAHGATTVSALDIEGGSTGLQGRLGDGRGKWQLFVTATGEIQVLSLMETASGHLVNLSTLGDAAGPP